MGVWKDAPGRGIGKSQVVSDQGGNMGWDEGVVVRKLSKAAWHSEEQPRARGEGLGPQDRMKTAPVLLNCGVSSPRFPFGKRAMETL